MSPIPPYTPEDDDGSGGGGGQSEAQVQAAIDASIAALVNGSPNDLDTLGEISGALNEDAAFATTVATSVTGVQSNLDAHINDGTDAHHAAAIGVADTGNHFASSDVEGALAELATASGGGSAGLSGGFRAEFVIPDMPHTSGDELSPITDDDLNVRVDNSAGTTDVAVLVVLSVPVYNTSGFTAADIGANRAFTFTYQGGVGASNTQERDFSIKKSGNFPPIPDSCLTDMHIVAAGTNVRISVSEYLQFSTQNGLAVFVGSDGGAPAVLTAIAVPVNP